jgi:release factor glutamine methyltransferase
VAAPAFEPPRESTLSALVMAARRYLATRRVVHPDWHAELILGGMLGLRRHELYLDPSRHIAALDMAKIRSALTRRADGEPTQYILGSTEFYGLPFRCDRRALIPRPETELLVDLALARLRALGPAARVVDLGTGTGCVAVALAVCMPGLPVTASDIDPNALSLARENAEQNGVALRVTFVHSDLFASLAGPFDLVAGNLPYVSPAARNELAVEVRDYEPAGALFADEDGLQVLRRAVAEAPASLAPAGALLLEIGFDQSDAVHDLCRRSGAYASIEIKRDYQGHPRVLVAVKNAN